MKPVSLMVARGIYRERNGWGNQHSARVKYDVGSELDMPEDRYKSRDTNRYSINSLGKTLMSVD